MATATIPTTFTNGTNADANLVNANFAYLASWLNTNAIQPSVANFSVFPTLPSSTPTSDYQAVHKLYVDQLMPAGVITQYVGTAAPSGWRMCDGSTYNAADTTYSRLWAAIGTTFGGSGINAFQVPDLRGRVPVGYGAGTGLTTRSLNDKSGAETVTLTAAQSGLPSHNHYQNEHQHTGGAHGHTFSTNYGGSHNHALPTVRQGAASAAHSGSTTIAAGFAGTDISLSTSSNYDHNHTGTTDDGGAVVTAMATPTNIANTAVNASEAHSVMQPYVVVSYIIKL